MQLQGGCLAICLLCYFRALLDDSGLTTSLACGPCWKLKCKIKIANCMRMDSPRVKVATYNSLFFPEVTTSVASIVATPLAILVMYLYNLWTERDKRSQFSACLHSWVRWRYLCVQMSSPRTRPPSTYIDGSIRRSNTAACYFLVISPRQCSFTPNRWCKVWEQDRCMKI